MRWTGPVRKITLPRALDLLYEAEIDGEGKQSKEMCTEHVGSCCSNESRCEE